MAKVLEIGDLSRNGLYQIVDTNWDCNGTLRVTVRELIGERSINAVALRAMRDLARRALMYPEKTRSVRVVRQFFADGSTHVTFDVSRLDD